MSDNNKAARQYVIGELVLWLFDRLPKEHGHRVTVELVERTNPVDHMLSFDEGHGECHGDHETCVSINWHTQANGLDYVANCTLALRLLDDEHHDWPTEIFRALTRTRLRRIQE